MALIALGVSGGIGAYKAVEVARGLQQRGHEVVAVMTATATRFVGPLTVQRRRGFANGFDGGDEGRAEPVADGCRQRRQALALGFQRAQRRGDERLHNRIAQTRAGRTLLRTHVRICPRQRYRRRHAQRQRRLLLLPGGEGVGEGAFARRAFLQRQNGAVAIGVDDGDVEPGPIFQQLDIARHLLLD